MSSTYGDQGELGGDDGDHHDEYQLQQHPHGRRYISRSSCIWEIEEEEDDRDEYKIPSEIKELFAISMQHNINIVMPSIKEEDIDIHDHDDLDRSVYVGVGKSDSSMDALTWTLNHAVSFTTLYLIHVFPEVYYIPTPLGKLPKSQVSPQQVETYMAQERGKRRELLQKFLGKCSASKVKVETILIESDMIGRAIVDLIPILNITRLVLGTTKSNLRKLMSRKGSGIADEILRSAPESCEVKIICGGNQVMMDQTTIVPPSRRANHDATKSTKDQEQRNEAFSCMCFGPKFS